MYSNLKKEMVGAEINIRELSELIGVSYNTFRNKIRDKTEWNITEMVKIQEILNDKNKTNKTIDYLFTK